MNEKQQIAARIKDLVEQLRQEMAKAQQEGLSITLTCPNEYSLAKRELSVEIVEVTTY
jgi:superfamily II helicase